MVTAIILKHQDEINMKFSWYLHEFSWSDFKGILIHLGENVYRQKNRGV